MLVPCAACDNGTGSNGNPCIICGGDGELNLLDDNFPKLTQERSIRGIVWDSMLTKLDDLEASIDEVKTKTDNLPNHTRNKLNGMEDKIDDVMDRCNDVLDKCNDIFEKVSE